MKIRRKELLTIMETTQSAILQENYRYYLKGMRFSFDKNNPMEVNIFTSDAHRVSIQKGILNEPCIVPDDYVTGGFIIPKKGVTEIIKLLSIDKNNPDEEIVLSVADNSLNAIINGIYLYISDISYCLKYFHIINSKGLSSGPKIAITGFRDSTFIQLLIDNGFDANDKYSVTKDTFALIADDINSTSSKVIKAKKYGIPVYTKSGFLQVNNIILQ
jgi:hypothetical protein